MDDGHSPKPDFDLSRVHEANLKILKELDRICRSHDIRYMLDAGTLLGAVRHEGFIPWDDDVDVAFTRAEFDKFLKVVRAELDSSMQLVMPDEYRDGHAFYDFTPRIIYLPSARHASGEEQAFYEGKLNHLWVDLFIIDQLPDGRLGQALCKFKQKLVYGLAMAHRYRLNMRKYTGLQRLQLGVLTSLGRFCSMPGLFRLQERWARVYSDRAAQGTSYRQAFYSNYQPDYLYVTVDNSWVQEVEDLPFEQERFMAPLAWDEVLRVVYGHYMQLPPEEKRVPSHSGRELEVWG